MNHRTPLAAGLTLMAIAEETMEHARTRGVEILAARTPDAVAEFNRLQSDPRKKVVAALHLTC